MRAPELAELDLLVVGSPTQGGRPTAAVQAFLSQLEPQALVGKSVAAFDTRISPAGQNFAIRLLIGIIGNAAGRIDRQLKAKGAVPVAEPEGFIVDDLHR